jgi:hypothetical protein
MDRKHKQLEERDIITHAVIGLYELFGNQSNYRALCLSLGILEMFSYSTLIS